MGAIVLFVCAPVLVPMLIVAFVLGLKGDEWFNHAPSRRERHYVRFFDEDDEDICSLGGDFSGCSGASGDSVADESGGLLYGGIPFGDGRLFLTDDDDFLGEFGDDVL